MSSFIGTVKISSDLIISIAGQAALDIDEVISVIGFNPNTLNNKNQMSNNSIKVDIVDKKIYLEMALVISKEARIPNLVKEVQQGIIDNVSAMTGLEVAKIDIYIPEVF